MSPARQAHLQHVRCRHQGALSRIVGDSRANRRAWVRLDSTRSGRSSMALRCTRRRSRRRGRWRMGRRALHVKDAHEVLAAAPAGSARRHPRSVRTLHPRTLPAIRHFSCACCRASSILGRASSILGRVGPALSQATLPDSRFRRDGRDSRRRRCNRRWLQRRPCRSDREWLDRERRESNAASGLRRLGSGRVRRRCRAMLLRSVQVPMNLGVLARGGTTLPGSFG
jgi:hypothetical protein